MNAQDVFRQSSSLREYNDFRLLFAQFENSAHSSALLDQVLDLAIDQKDSNALSFCNVANGLRIEVDIDVGIEFAKRIVESHWAPASADAIGTFDRFGSLLDISFLKSQAELSVWSWLERDDEFQTFFRKCVWAISRIGERTDRLDVAFNALVTLSSAEPPTAAYWAKKQLNRFFDDASPYWNDDLAEQPEADWEWPGNRKKSVLKHAIYAEHDYETVSVYQAYSEKIGKAAALKGSLDVPAFSKSRMTWIKPSFNWMMYRCGWGKKDKNQSTILKLKLRRPEFFHLIYHGALSQKPTHGVAEWESKLEKFPNRIQWDPDRTPQGQPLERRAIQIGIAPEFVDFYLHQTIAEIEDITDVCHRMHHDLSELPKDPQEPIFWP